MTPIRRCRGVRGDAGPLEVAILAPVLLLLIVFIAAAGQVTSADADVTHAARVAARAAAGHQTAAGAVDAAHTAATATLTADRCDRLDVNVDTGDFHTGGTVRVDVACTITLAETSRFGIPGTRTLTATALETIDATRGGP